jgi:hypothetical protein
VVVDVHRIGVGEIAAPSEIAVVFDALDERAAPLANLREFAGSQLVGVVEVSVIVLIIAQPDGSTALRAE